MTLRDTSEAIERIAASGVKSPFTFWVLLAVTVLAVIMAGGSFWLLGQQLGAHDSRYARLFEVLAESAETNQRREALMIDELQRTRTEYSQNLQQVVGMLIEQSPTKLEESRQEEVLRNIQEDSQTIKELRKRQDQILLTLDQIRLYMDGKTGR